MNALILDLRVALRRLAASPGFTAVAVAVLALGLGAATAVWSLADRTLLRPPPFPDPDRLMVLELTSVWGDDPQTTLGWSAPWFAGLAERDRAFSELAAFQGLDLNLLGPDRSERVSSELVSADYLAALGVEPVVGRAFTAAEAAQGEAVALVSDGLWRRELGGDPAAVGRVLRLDDVPVTVIGVLPPGFGGLTRNAEIWLPLSLAPRLYYPEALEEPWNFWLQAVGRLRPGTRPETARDQVRRAVGEVAAGFALPVEAEVEWGAEVRPLAEARTAPRWRLSLLVLAGAVGCLLLLMCANLAALVLVRAGGRRRELAVRAALGAGRRRLVQQVAVETLLLAGLAGAAALMIAWWVLELLPSWVPADPEGGLISRAADLGASALDPRVLVFELAAAVAVALAVGLVPAVRAARLDPAAGLRGGGEPGGGRRAWRGGFAGADLLAAAEIGVALVLLVGAGLLVQSFVRLVGVDPGFDPEHTLTFRFEPAAGAYPAGAEAAALQRRVLERMAVLPGVEAASVDRCAPLSSECPETLATFLEGQPPVALDAAPRVQVHPVGPEHFRALGVPLLAGRGFDRRDVVGAPPAVVLGRTAARRLFGDQDPVGKRLALAMGMFRGEGATAEVVGVVGDVLYGAAGEPAPAVVYLSALQYAYPGGMVLVRTAGDPMALAPAVRAAMRDVDPALPPFDLRRLADRAGDAYSEARFRAVLVAVFAAAALVLAALGVYGVMAQAVSRRRRELGVRSALGARRGQLLALVLRRGLAVTAAGVVAGIAGAAAAGRLVAGLLFDVAPGDPATLGGVAAVLAVVALAASWLPARRAMRADPAVALRSE